MESASHRLFVFLFSVRAMAQSRPTLASFCLAAIIDTTQPTIERRDCSVQLDTTTTSSSTLQARGEGLCAAACGLSYRARIGFLRDVRLLKLPSYAFFQCTDPPCRCRIVALLILTWHHQQSPPRSLLATSSQSRRGREPAPTNLAKHYHGRAVVACQREDHRHLCGFPAALGRSSHAALHQPASTAAAAAQPALASESIYARCRRSQGSPAGQACPGVVFARARIDHSHHPDARRGPKTTHRRDSQMARRSRLL